MVHYFKNPDRHTSALGRKRPVSLNEICKTKSQKLMLAPSTSLGLFDHYGPITVNGGGGYF